VAPSSQLRNYSNSVSARHDAGSARVPCGDAAKRWHRAREGGTPTSRPSSIAALQRHSCRSPAQRLRAPLFVRRGGQRVGFCSLDNCPAESHCKPVRSMLPFGAATRPEMPNPSHDSRPSFGSSHRSAYRCSQNLRGSRQIKVARPILALGLLLFAALLSPAGPKAPSKKPSAHVAGQITALIPEDHVLRQDETLVAAKDMPVLLDDVVKTDRGGRVRIALSDGSILNIGSEAQMRILQYDTKHQETTLELLYGRLLITAVKLVKPRGKFDVRSPIAVAGVVGTSFGLRVDPDFADVLCKEGTVRVRNADSTVFGEVILKAGEFTHVERGKPPTPPALAFPERIRAGEEATSIPGNP
jgi:hypothetical protein